MHFKILQFFLKKWLNNKKNQENILIREWELNVEKGLIKYTNTHIHTYVLMH